MDHRKSKYKLDITVSEAELDANDDFTLFIDDLGGLEALEQRIPPKMEGFKAPVTFIDRIKSWLLSIKKILVRKRE